ncbi:hypothetical protein Agub_g4350 [Astrephomene gubernaculifera]|uniref:Uncharacterized protein n=1 Tax=Astrephomene gubernaculifera TaxID=47775 RepID=A0AAD3DK24_9CHLO|nr:hypothetical protein Agub_g4350 [Astrephomene gubernaculifera]
MATCAICDHPALFRCGKCKSERYCSRECQRDHWPHHKKSCPQLAAAAAAAAAARAAEAHDSDTSGNATLAQPQPDAAGGSGSPGPPPQPPTPQPPSLPQPQPPAVGPGGGAPRLHPRAGRLLTDLAATAAPSQPQPGQPGMPSAAAAAAAAGLPANGGSGGGGGSSNAAAVGSSQQAPRPYPQPPPHPPPQPLAPRPPSSSQPPAAQGPRGRQFRPMQAPPEAHAAAAAGLPYTRGGGSGSILDRIMPAAASPPPPVPPQPSPAVGTASSSAASPSAATTFLTTVEVETPPQQPLPSWPWASSVASAPSAASLPDLPSELLLLVLRALPPKTLAAAAAVCRAWRRAAREPWLWVRHLCAAGYVVPPAAWVPRGGPPQQSAANRCKPSPGSCASEAAAVATAGPAAPCGGVVEGGASEVQEGQQQQGPGAVAVAGVRGIRAVRAVRAAVGGGGGAGSHEDFLGGLRAGFLDRLQHQHQQQQQQQGQQHPQQQQQQQRTQHRPPQTAPAKATTPAAPAAAPAVDLKGLFARTTAAEANWRSCRYAESCLREHSSNVECLAFQSVEPWGPVLLSAAWDGSVRVFALGPAGPGPGGGPQQARCVRRYLGHSGWVTCMAAGRRQVVTASTDRRVAAWRYQLEDSGSDPWVTLEHPLEVTLVRFCYAPPPPPTTHYLAHHLRSTPEACGQQQPHQQQSQNSGTTEVAPPPTGHATSSNNNNSNSSADSLQHHSQQQQGALSSSSTFAAQLPPCNHHLPYDPSWEDWVATGCVDGVVRLWHLPSRQLLRVMSGHRDVVWGMSALEGSSVLVTSGRDGSTKIWPLPSYGELAAEVAAKAATVTATVAAATVTAGAKSLDAMATLCGHSSAILCMDTIRAPPGVVPPAATEPASTTVTSTAAAGAMHGAAAGAGGGGGGRPEDAPPAAVHLDMLSELIRLLNTGPICAPGAGSELAGAAATAVAGATSSSRSSVGAAAAGGGAKPAATSAAAAAAAAANPAALPVWLVATGGADAVVRVWNLTSARCQATLRGHTHGVLSVRLGYLPRRGADSQRHQLLLPPDLDVTAAAPPPSLPNMTLPPGLYGSDSDPTSSHAAHPPLRHRRRQVMPPTQRLVLVSGSVGEVRVWDPVAGSALAVLSGDHSGPVTSLALVHGMLVTLAMNDGIIVYKCNGLDGCEGDGCEGEGGSSNSNTGGSSSSTPGGDRVSGAVTGARRSSNGGSGGGGAAMRLRQVVAAHRPAFEPVIWLQDGPHHSFAAALAARLEGLAVGSGSGEVTYLDFRPR